MKKITILILLISLLLSCNENNSSDFSKEESSSENINKLNGSSLLGAWKYEDSYFGKVFLQFEIDGTVKVFYNYEGDILGVGKWEYQDNIVIISDVNILDKLIISDFDGNSFKIPPTIYDSIAKTNKKYIVVNRLKDAFEPILFLFNNRERYSNNEENVSHIIEEKSNYSNSGSTQKQWVNCRYCHGKGVEECYSCEGRGENICSTCKGKGTQDYWRKDGNGTEQRNCYNCGGKGNRLCSGCSGKGKKGSCSRCDGRGQVQE
jgi:hypothetical protein